MSLTIFLAMALATTVAGSPIHADLSLEAVEQVVAEHAESVAADHKRLFVLSQPSYNRFLVFSTSLKGEDPKFETDLTGLRTSYSFNPTFDVTRSSSGVPQIVYSNFTTLAAPYSGITALLNLLPVGSTAPQNVYSTPSATSSFQYLISQVLMKDGQAWFTVSSSSSTTSSSNSDSTLHSLTLFDRGLKTQTIIPHGFVFPGTLVFDVDTEKELVFAGGCVQASSSFTCGSNGVIFFAGYGSNRAYAPYLIELPGSQVTSLALVDEHLYFTVHTYSNTSLYSIPAQGHIVPKLLLTYDGNSLVRTQMRVDNQTLFVNGINQIFAFEVNDGELVSNSTVFTATDSGTILRVTVA